MIVIIFQDIVFERLFVSGAAEMQQNEMTLAIIRTSSRRQSITY